MGSFYSTCSVSGMTLTGNQPIVRFLLLPQHSGDTYDTRNLFKAKGVIVSNEGAMAGFVPFGFPIRGKYDDCGEIDEVVEDDGVKMLEAFFGTDIYRIMAMASDDRWMTHGRKKKDKDNSWKLEQPGMKNVDLLEKMTYTDIRAEVYEYLAGTEEQIQASIAAVAAATTNLSSGSYDQFFMRQWTEWRDSYFKLCDRYESGKVKPGDDVDDIDDEDDEDDVIVDDGKLDVTHLISLLKKPAEDQAEDPEAVMMRRLAFKRFAKRAKRMSSYDIQQRCFIRSYDRDNMFISLLPWIRRSHEPIIVGMRNFVTSLTEMRKIILPSAYGSQDTNWSALLAFNEHVNGILKEDLATEAREYKEYKEKYGIKDEDDE